MGHVQLVDLPDPNPTSKDVVVKVIASGICGTDSTEYNLKNTGAVLPGHQFGHEFAGTVAEVGSEVTEISVGMRVTVKPLTATRAGRRNSCMIGGFSEYMLVEDAAVGYNIYPLPQELSFEAGALVEPFSVGMHGVNLAKPQPKERALILGAGPIGLSARTCKNPHSRNPMSISLVLPKAERLFTPVPDSIEAVVPTWRTVNTPQWHEFQAAMATHNCSGAVEHAYTEAPAILERA